jgi:hypothetical protein
VVLREYKDTSKSGHIYVLEQSSALDILLQHSIINRSLDPVLGTDATPLITPDEASAQKSGNAHFLLCC